jgi:hypothetical protein
MLVLLNIGFSPARAGLHPKHGAGIVVATDRHLEQLAADDAVGFRETKLELVLKVAGQRFGTDRLAVFLEDHPRDEWMHRADGGEQFDVLALLFGGFEFCLGHK